MGAADYSKVGTFNLIHQTSPRPRQLRLQPVSIRLSYGMSPRRIQRAAGLPPNTRVEQLRFHLQTLTRLALNVDQHQ